MEGGKGGKRRGGKREKEDGPRTTITFYLPSGLGPANMGSRYGCDTASHAFLLRAPVNALHRFVRSTKHYHESGATGEVDLFVSDTVDMGDGMLAERRVPLMDEEGWRQDPFGRTLSEMPKHWDYSELFVSFRE